MLSKVIKNEIELEKNPENFSDVITEKLNFGDVIISLGNIYSEFLDPLDVY